jgi:hypothetical protein
MYKVILLHGHVFGLLLTCIQLNSLFKHPLILEENDRFSYMFFDFGLVLAITMTLLAGIGLICSLIRILKAENDSSN